MRWGSSLREIVEIPNPAVVTTPAGKFPPRRIDRRWRNEAGSRDLGRHRGITGSRPANQILAGTGFVRRMERAARLLTGVLGVAGVVASATLTAAESGTITRNGIVYAERGWIDWFGPTGKFTEIADLKDSHASYYSPFNHSFSIPGICTPSPPSELSPEDTAVLPPESIRAYVSNVEARFFFKGLGITWDTLKTYSIVAALHDNLNDFISVPSDPNPETVYTINVSELSQANYTFVGNKFLSVSIPIPLPEEPGSLPLGPSGLVGRNNKCLSVRLDPPVSLRGDFIASGIAAWSDYALPQNTVTWYRSGGGISRMLGAGGGSPTVQIRLRTWVPIAIANDQAAPALSISYLPDTNEGLLGVEFPGDLHDGWVLQRSADLVHWEELEPMREGQTSVTIPLSNEAQNVYVRAFKPN